MNSPPPSTETKVSPSSTTIVMETTTPESTTTTPPLQLSYKPLPTPIKGQSDWRAYRAVKLPNGVTVCVVQDKESKTTAVAASVNVGACSDPRSYPGLAHFLEHMCFLGSTKYPGENQYKSYLSQHGGQSNASTSLFLTTYKFEVLADYGEAALDIFAQFFVCPLLTASGTEREIHAVDSENSKNLTSDVRRRLQILKDNCDPNHYFTKFTTGNVSTLLRPNNINVDNTATSSSSHEQQQEQQVAALRQALLSFHAHHYRSDQLTVVAVGPQTVDTLLEWIVPRFATMPSQPPLTSNADSTITQLIQEGAKEAPPYGYPNPKLPFVNPLKSHAMQSLIVTKPIKSQRRLVLMFPIPPTQNPDRSAVSVLSHLLGHEGPQSSFAILQDMNWITSLSAGPRTTTPDFQLLQIDLQLTPSGEEHWKDVIAVLFQHAQLLHQQAIELQQQDNATSDSKDQPHHRLLDIWMESLALSQLMFHQSSPSNAYSFAPTLCQQIVEYGTQQCLCAGCGLQETIDTFPLQDLVDVSSRLTIENCFIERCSELAWKEWEDMESSTSSSATDTTSIVARVVRKTEPWYGVDYFSMSLDDDDIRGWKEPGYQNKFMDATHLLNLPRPNRYIPRTLELCPDLPDDAKDGPRIDQPIDPPKLIVTNDVGRLWHRLDDRYALPKAVVTLLIRNAAVENIPMECTDGSMEWQHDDRAVVLSSLLSSIYAQAQAQETYDADLAGLHWSVSLNSAGILLSCSGFSDRLSDLALKLLQDFVNGSFVQESYFKSSRDRIVRNLKTFLESRRADSDSMYYRDLLLTSNSQGIHASLQAAEAVTIQDVKDHHRTLMSNTESVVECLYTGNVSKDEASAFYDSVTSVLQTSMLPQRQSSGAQAWIPGDVERRLMPGKDVELHLNSRNPQEENGAVLVTYQSHIPGFRGDKLSSNESLQSTAAIRLLSHILREPLFDELRTKQTLGYIVSSYYDWFVASRPSHDAASGPLRVPVDSLVINVLSRKLPPPQICQRIDDFLDHFRDSLCQMPESQIQHHASALSTKLLKPIHKLGVEATMHFAKITRYAPEVLDNNGGGSEADLPWDSVQSLAHAIESLQRDDLIQAWDRLTHPSLRARIVSCVYGTTFPLKKDAMQQSSGTWSNKLIVWDDASQLVANRRLFPAFDNTTSRLPFKSRLLWSRALPQLSKIPSSPQSLKVATALVIGAGITAAGWTIFHQYLRKSNK